MNVRRSPSRLIPPIAALALAILTTSSPGCGPISEGRPPGSIEAKTSRTKASDVDDIKAKAKSSRARRR